jgi:PAS domain-containing protein
MQYDWRVILDPGFGTAMALSAGIGIGVVVRLLQRKKQKAEKREGHATAERLSAALDRIDIGIVLLNADTRAEFINRAFRNYFALPDDKADSKPPLIALMYHGRDTHAYELPEDEVDAFIARRVEMIRAGDPTPINVRLASGQVLRLSCTVLPDGGRMLSYTPITDLIRRNDDLADRDSYLSLRGGGDVFSGGHLRAAE